MTQIPQQVPVADQPYQQKVQDACERAPQMQRRFNGLTQHCAACQQKPMQSCGQLWTTCEEANWGSSRHAHAWSNPDGGGC
jgi:hypothetical protein